MLITSLDYSPYLGRIAVGRVHRGALKNGQNVTLAKKDGSKVRCKIKELHTFSGMGRMKVEEVKSGDICALIGIEGFEIGDTICDFENPEALDPIAIDEPTMSMVFTINDSPFFGKDGKFVTSRHIQDRLNKELEKNLALRVERGTDETSWNVFGRGVLHLSVLVETMRREGYELQVGQPQVIIKEIDGVKCEPVEQLTVNTPEECSGKIIEYVSTHKGEMTRMEMINDRVQLEFVIPSPHGREVRIRCEDEDWQEEFGDPEHCKKCDRSCLKSLDSARTLTTCPRCGKEFGEKRCISISEVD